jgi:universal stress protein A
LQRSTQRNAAIKQKIVVLQEVYFMNINYRRERMFKNILLATDLSTNSDFVGKRAKYIADLYGAKLSVVYAFDYVPVAYGGGEFAVPLDTELMSDMEKNSHHSLAKLGKLLNIPEERQYFITMNSVRNVIVDLAGKIKADLIVIGSHGTHGPALLLGSTANSVLHSANCTVLAVRI